MYQRTSAPPRATIGPRRVAFNLAAILVVTAAFGVATERRKAEALADQVRTPATVPGAASPGAVAAR